MIAWIDIVQNCVSVLALAVLYDIAYRLSQNFPQYLRYDVAVALAFGAVIIFMQLNPSHVQVTPDTHPIHMGFELLLFVALIGGWLSGVLGLMIYLGVDWLIYQHTMPVPYMLFLVVILILGYALRVGYKANIASYKITELLAIWLVCTCLLVLIPLMLSGTSLLIQMPDIFAQWVITLFITFMLLGLVMRRVERVHQTEQIQKQRAEYEGFLTKSISDEIMHVRFSESGEILEVKGMFDYHNGAPYPDPRNADNTLRWMELCHPDDVPIARGVFTDLFAGKPVVVELRIQVELDKPFVWRRVHGVPIMNKLTGRLERGYFALKDIEAEKRAQDEQHKAQFERQRVDILKAFSVQAEHQFRTPLTSIHTNIYLLRKVTDEAKRARYLDNIEAQAHLLLELVESLNLLTQIEIREELTIHNIQLNEIIQGVLPSFITKAKFKNVEIKTVLDASLPKLYANHQFIKSSVVHLLRNAVAHTLDGGTITVQTQVAHDEQGKKGVLLVIEDTGVGMSEVVLAHAFERFFRADTAQTSAGLGLGLPLVKEVADHYGGSVKLTSKVGQGTTVMLHLPVLG